MMQDTVEKLVGLKNISAQFQNLDGVHPALWPPVPRYIVLLLTFAMVVVVSYLVIFSSLWDEFNLLVAKEEEQKKELVSKFTKVNSLEQLRELKYLSMQRVSTFEQQLPDKASMDTVLSEINQAGVNRGLQFESFKPGDIETKEFIAELPITIKMTGNYHALAGFVSDVANLSRLVVIDHIAMTAVREGMQNFDAVVRIFYQKDEEESTKKKKKQIDNPQRATS